ncbi:hypothetical protein FALBO_12354 [Fusarium albosuccineum]|uniref:Uncharacterized protein n=1 Tax=Fusarium albosuccineum TaxID=1237068 RepID=A0A8H4L3A7_9HYPO|nr:hypothetical protein FALBO_12354 [Fusarium albosuccineum]
MIELRTNVGVSPLWDETACLQRRLFPDLRPTQPHLPQAASPVVTVSDQLNGFRVMTAQTASVTAVTILMQGEIRTQRRSICASWHAPIGAPWQLPKLLRQYFDPMVRETECPEKGSDENKSRIVGQGICSVNNQRQDSQM